MKTCCVDGCGKRGTHTRRFTIASDGWGETEVEAVFCCSHYDSLLEQTPSTTVDVRVHGEVRDLS